MGEMTTREREHLEHAIQIKADRRPVDAAAGLTNLADWRDWLLCAASNLECGPPQQQPATAAKLRALADQLVRMDLAHQDLVTTRDILRLAVLPVVERREDLHLIRQIKSLVGEPHD